MRFDLLPPGSVYPIGVWPPRDVDRANLGPKRQPCGGYLYDEWADVGQCIVHWDDLDRDGLFEAVQSHVRNDLGEALGDRWTLTFSLPRNYSGCRLLWALPPPVQPSLVPVTFPNPPNLPGHVRIRPCDTSGVIALIEITRRGVTRGPSLVLDVEIRRDESLIDSLRWAMVNLKKAKWGKYEVTRILGEVLEAWEGPEGERANPIYSASLQDRNSAIDVVEPLGRVLGDAGRPELWHVLIGSE